MRTSATALRVAGVTLLVSVLLAAVACAATDSRAAKLQFAPSAHADANDDAGGPLDLTSVTFGQQTTLIDLRLQLAQPWQASMLSQTNGPTLCVVLVYPSAAIAPTRICVVDDHGAAGLTYAHLDSAGRPHRTSPLVAFLSRPDPRTISAAFTPLAARLPHGRFGWQAESVWTNHSTCAAPNPCVDDVPDADRVVSRISLLAEPRCFGAASRDPRRPCTNPALRHAVVPTPEDALITPNAYCKQVQRSGLLSVCAFGATVGQAATTIALVGDSHAEHWRGALEVVAQARRWHGVSIVRPGCPFSTARRAGPKQPGCARWNRQLRRWFKRHPRISTVIVSAHKLVKYDSPAKAGYQSAWRRLPTSVKHVIVIHDTPETESPPAHCVNHALRHHQRAGALCGGKRSFDLGSDPEADAAYALRSHHVKVVNLSHYMCSSSRCFAVVGGALVRKDESHITSVFSTTLGPYLLRAINRALR